MDIGVTKGCRNHRRLIEANDLRFGFEDED